MPPSRCAGDGRCVTASTGFVRWKSGVEQAQEFDGTALQLKLPRHLIRNRAGKTCSTYAIRTGGLDVSHCLQIRGGNFFNAYKWRAVSKHIDGLVLSQPLRQAAI